MKEREPPGTRRPQQVSNHANRRQDSLPWGSLEQQVVRMQKQIAQAAQRGDKQAVHDLQQRLMESEAARLLAVRRVAEENQGKDTAGVDGIKSLGPKERLAMASTIHPRYWNEQPPMPVRRVWVPKPGTAERRPLAILSMIDRCKQALVKLALEPEWEVKFEQHSYGFRPGRGAHDALAAIVVTIERQPMFVFDADIEEAFDHVDQAAVLDKLQTYPALRQVINAWFTAGVMDGGSYSPSETGIAQGGVLSPLLMNVALHGLETVVTEDAPGGHSREQPLLVRYADDFVILHPDLKELQQAVRRARRWLARVGLHFHADKTRITHTLTPYQGQPGFDFLGFNIHQEAGEKTALGMYGQESLPGNKTKVARAGASPAPTLLRSGPHNPYRVGAGLAPALVNTPRVKAIITPSQEASKRHLAAIDQRLQQLQTASQARVIEELNPLIIGWAAYYNGVVPATTMSRYDELLEQRLMKWASKRHPGKARDWLLNRYWQASGQRGRVFATRDGVLRPYRQMSILKG
jgi:RNA-directed DNA polymerase